MSPATTTDSPVIFVTGCSTGLGRQFVRAAVDQGFRVIATARRPGSIEDLQSERVHTLRLDVNSSEEELSEAVKQAHGVFGRIDVLINNAGYLLAGAMEEFSHREMLSQFETLVFGVFKLTNAVLPAMRSQGRGIVLNVSSQGGSLNIPGAGVYCAAKAAIDSATDAYDKELSPLGLRACSLQVGSFATDVASSGNLQQASRTFEAYEPSHQWAKDFNSKAGKEPGDPAKLAQRVMHLVELQLQGQQALPRRLPLGDDAVANVAGALEANLLEVRRHAHLGQTLSR